jgi:DNA-directed RNA polymerase subunit L
MSDPAKAVVRRVSIARRELRHPLLKSVFRLDRLPLANSEVEIEIEGVPTAVVNALRRTVLDEMVGHCLQVPDGGFDSRLTTDVFMLPQFVNDRVACVPLRPRIAADIVERLRLTLDVSNTTPEVLPFYTGDFKVAPGCGVKLTEPLFNPTFKLGFLQPGKRIVLRDVRIATGRGRDHGAFCVARRAAHRHLDLPEHTRAETHERGGVALDLSGYKVSSLVATPRHHVLRATVPATSANPAEVRAVFADACATVAARLLFVAAALDARDAADGVQYSVVVLDDGLSEGTLVVPGETPTIGELLRRAIYDATPEIAYVSQIVVDHENCLRVTVRHTGDVTRLLRDAVASSVETFSRLGKGILAAR